MRRARSQILHGMLLATSGLVGSTLIATAAMAAGPTGGTVAVGSATITNPSSTQTVINQTTKKALINWNSFSVSAGSSVTFNQPNTKSLTVNRVTGPNASQIDGQLLANGNIWLINANGILFGHGSQVNVGALMATTSDISDSDFENGNYNFKPAANPDAGVVNQGTITAGRGGSVVLSAPRVSNEGLIKADLGTVVLGGAKAFTVDMTGDNLLRYQISAPVDSAPKDSSGKAAPALVSNSGTIEAAGGRVMLTARAASSIQDNVINNTGMVEATSISSHNGEIDLDAGPDGTVNDGGSLDASGTASGQMGGTVNVTGGTVVVADGAKINVSGAQGGGTVQLGGGLHGQGTLAHSQQTTIGKATITADAVTNGNGGTVAVWSDGNTSFAGTISARGGANGGNGGQVETSGHTLGVAAAAKVDTTAPLGLSGDWLLDPTNLFITSCIGQSACCGSTCVDSTTVATNLGSTDITESATNSLTLDSDSDISWNSAHTLNLLSQGDITINSSIQNAGSGAINVIAGWDGSTTNFVGLASSSTAYGNNSASLIIGGSGADGDIAVGSAHGVTTIASSDVNVQAVNGSATIGYLGVGGGDISVLAKNNITVSGTTINSCEGECNFSVFGAIGNGDGSTAGTVTGNISLVAGGNTDIRDDGEENFGYLGNFSADGSIETGNVTVITQSGNLFGDYFTNDLGTDPGTGGNVFVGFTGTSGIYSLGGLGNYNSPNAFTWAAAASLQVSGRVQNDGTGAVNVIAGWDGHTTNLASLMNAGVYGNNNGSVIIQGGEGAAIGSKGGATLVEGYDITLDAFTSDAYAQIGYDGSGATGSITVRARHNLTLTGGEGGGDCDEECVSSAYAQIGHGAAGVSNLSESGAISVVAGGDITLSGGDSSMGTDAQIGHGGDESNGSLTGDITVSGTNISLAADEGHAQIGNGGAASGFTSSGNITVTATGDVTVSGGGVDTWGYGLIGNGGDSQGGNDTGNIGITAASLTLTGGGDFAQVGNGGWGSGGAHTGDITINTTGDVTVQGGTVNSFSYAQIGNGGESSSGSDSGNITITTPGTVTIAAGSASNGRYAQIGNGVDENGSSASSSGNISVTAGSLVLQGSTSSASDDYTLLGNTAVLNANVSGSGSATGNISINVSGATTLTSMEGGGDVWIGNYSGNGGTETGDVSLIGNTFNTDNENNDDVRQFVGADLVGGNVTIGVKSATSQFKIGDELDYSSANSLTLLTAGNITISGGIQNAGTGNITVVTGWNPNVAPANVLTTAGAYGNNNSILTIGGSGASGNSYLGSAGGTTTVLTNALTINAANGSAQLGYHGAGGGNIVVDALGAINVDTNKVSSLAFIGNGGSDISGAITGTISVSSFGAITVDTFADQSVASIGNIGGTGSSDSGDILINTHGAALSLISNNPGQNGGAMARVGFIAEGDTSGAASGNISIQAGAVSLLASGGKSFTEIGTGSIHTNHVDTGALSGNINIGASSLTMVANGTLGSAQARIGNLGDGTVRGDVNITTTGSVLVESIGNSVSSIGGLSAVSDANNNPLQGQGSGNLTVNSGGAITLLAQNGGSARIESGGFTTGNVNVTASGNILLDVDSGAGSNATGGLAFIGGLGSGNSAVNVSVASTNGGIDLEAKDASSQVQIGNSQNGAAGTISGTLTVSALQGAVTMNDSGAGSRALVGNTGPSFGGNVTITGQSVDGVRESIDNDLTGGNFTVSSLGTDALTIDQAANYDSAFDLVVNSGGSIVFDASVQNAGTGDITFTSAGTITVGGSGATGGVAVGSAGGSTTLKGTDVLLTATNGYAQIGYHGGGSGAINVSASGDVVLTGGGSADLYAQIGDGGFNISGSSSAPITVDALGNVALNGGAGQEAYAQIGNGGAESNSSTGGYSETGDITVGAANVLLSAGSGAASYSQIGNGGYKSGQSLNGIATLGGNITVVAQGSVALLGGGADAYAQIGDGGDSININAANGSSGTIGGNISVTVANPGSNPGAKDEIMLTAGSGANSYAQIGNGGVFENVPVAGANVSFSIGGTVSIADLTLTGSNTGADGYSQVGNGDAASTGFGNVTGIVTIQGTTVTVIPGKAPGASAGVGNDTGTGTVGGTVANQDNGVNDPGTQGSIASTIQNPVTPTNFNITQANSIPFVFSSGNFGTEDSQGPSPLEQLADSSDLEGQFASDTVSQSVGKSLDGKTVYVTTKTIIPGVLKQIVAYGPTNPHGVPPADEDYSSWGNEAFWRW